MIKWKLGTLRTAGPSIEIETLTNPKFNQNIVTVFGPRGNERRVLSQTVEPMDIDQATYDKIVKFITERNDACSFYLVQLNGEGSRYMQIDHAYLVTDELKIVYHNVVSMISASEA